ncbi:hypothetical protein HCN44_000799 [Aphidius gifuensis]|uniref:Uncharacterized protein n=1 Tax=Aphidius gifuensis TaxID=684658 RepID=A0A835CPT2_APHGI|nr:hypothetical protein HCN44_000799 [Aphidius gifuensis]
MHEEHEHTPWWKSKFFISKSERSYPINLIPQTWWENFRAKYISATNIMRRANYNMTLFHPSYFHDEVKTYDNTSTSVAMPEIEHIGHDDNSCSLKLSIEFLEKNFKHLYTKDCLISATYYDSNSKSSHYRTTGYPLAVKLGNTTKKHQVLIPIYGAGYTGLNNLVDESVNIFNDNYNDPANNFDTQISKLGCGLLSVEEYSSSGKVKYSYRPEYLLPLPIPLNSAINKDEVKSS